MKKKNTYLTRGRRKDDKGLRHADSRMSYNADLKALVDIVVDWASTNRNPFSLYVKLRDLNKSMGSVEKYWGCFFCFIFFCFFYL